MAISDFFGNGWDDPRSGQIMGLAEGLLSAPGGQGIAAGLRGMREAQDADAKRKYMLAQMGLVDVQAKTGQAQLDELKRKNADEDKAREVARQFYSANGLPGASPASPGTATGMMPPAIGLGGSTGGSMPTGATPAAPMIAQGPVAPKADAWLRYKALGDEYAKNGLTARAESAYSLAEKFRPKYSTEPRVVRDPVSGKLVNLLVGEDGSTTVMPYGVKPDINMQDLGGRVVAVDKNDLTNGQAFDKSATPGEVLSNNLGWANNATTRRGQDLTDARQRETISLQRDKQSQPVFHDGQWVSQPTTANPAGQAVQVPGFQKPPGEAAKKQLSGIESLNGAIGEYLQQMDGWDNRKMLSPNARAAMGTKYNNMMLQAKEAYNLGVLNGPDYQILTSVIADPRAPSSALLSNDTLADQAKELRRLMGGTAGAVRSGGANAERSSLPGYVPNGKQSAISGGGWSATKVP